MTTWDNQMPQYAGYFGSDEQILGLARSARFITQTASQIDANEVIRIAKDSCKADLKERVSIRAQGIFPDSIAYYKGIWERAQQKLYSIYYPSGFPAFGYVSIYGTFIDITEQGYTDTPLVYVNFGVPDNATFAGTADNGSFCWNTKNSTIYIQRGTLDINDWQYFDASGLVDFIVNPEVLHRAFLYGTLYYLFEERATNDTTSSIRNLDAWALQEHRYYEKYEDFCKRAMTLLDIDTSNGGVITSFDTKFQRAKNWAIV